MEVPLLEIDLPSEFEQRLDALAKKTGQSKGALAREAVLRHIEGIEDYDLALHRLACSGPRVSLESLEQGIDTDSVPE